MFIFFDGAVLTALALGIALVLGLFADAHPEWPVFRNETIAQAIVITLTCASVIGCVTAWIACLEYSLPVLPLMALYIAIQAAIVFLFKAARRMSAARLVPVT